MTDDQIAAIVKRGATAEPGIALEVNLHIYWQVDGRWVIEEEIGIFAQGL